MTPVVNSGLHVVGKLCIDADLKWLYSGEYSGEGRPKKYDGKVDKEADIERLDYKRVIDDGKTQVYTSVVHSVSPVMQQ